MIQPTEPSPAQVQALMQLFSAQRYTEAAAQAQAMTQQFPRYAFGWTALGAMLKQLGRGAEALAPFTQAVQLSPSNPEAHNNLGVAQRENQQLAAAIQSYQRALQLQPHYPQAHCNLGNALADTGQLAPAVDSYRKALAQDPAYAQAHSNLANTLALQGQLQEAAQHYARALDIAPHMGTALTGMAYVLHSVGDHTAAMAWVQKSLQLDPTPEAQSVFVDCAKYLRPTQDDAALRAWLLRGLTTPWGRPAAMTGCAMALVNLQPAISACRARANQTWPARLSATQLFGPAEMPALQALEADTLLHAVLQAAQISDVPTERFLTQCRGALLGLALQDEGDEAAIKAPAAWAFCGALAQQCFVNDYVFSTTPDEDLACARLREKLINAIGNGEPVPPLWPLALAMFTPLGSVPGAQALLAQPTPHALPVLPVLPALQAVLRQQVQEPLVELEMRDGIHAITPIDDAVSKRVQNQYEESPYPRWVQLPRHCTVEPIEATLRRILPGAPLQALPQPVPAAAPASILVAGCGTGQQAIECALRFAQAQVLAIDLSLSSLAYAQRKTAEIAQQETQETSAALALSRIRYAQADLLQLGALDQRFDLIESCGVLHHLNDPQQGWRVLLNLLRPGGVMKLGFYSEVARRQVVRIRELIASQGRATTVQDIRACRQELMSPEHFGTATQSSDFFATSTCRDLLFHVQEHRTSLTAIAAFLQNNGLVFLGFETEPHVVHAYKARFPNDPTATDLAQWQVFENENPDVFFNMYQFWVQKPLQG